MLIGGYLLELLNFLSEEVRDEYEKDGFIVDDIEEGEDEEEDQVDSDEEQKKRKRKKRFLLLFLITRPFLFGRL